MAFRSFTTLPPPLKAKVLANAHSPYFPPFPRPRLCAWKWVSLEVRRSPHETSPLKAVFFFSFFFKIFFFSIYLREREHK